MIKIGIVGLPNVGKSSFFKLLTRMDVLIANYPFATIDKNVAVIPLYDSRLLNLMNIYNSKKDVYGNIKLYDIAGLVKGASKGDGLGNEFLSHVQEVDALCHVIRLFNAPDILHVENNIHPVSDFKIINDELILKDISIIENALPKIKKIMSVKKDALTMYENDVLEKAKNCLYKEMLLFEEKWSEEDILVFKKHGLISYKSYNVLINISEDQIKTYKDNGYYKELVKTLNSLNINHFVLPTMFIEEINTLDENERQEFVKIYKDEKIFLTHFFDFILDSLNINTFFTCGENEVHAWFFKKNSYIKDAVANIHNDFKKFFVSSTVIKYNDINTYKSEKVLREKGLIYNVSKDYILQDGDIINVTHTAK